MTKTTNNTQFSNYDKYKTKSQKDANFLYPTSAIEN